MNLSLVDPFVLAQDCPEVLTGSLRNGHSAYVRFSHRGDMLASGRLSGTIVIFDIETHGVACKLRGHTRQIQSLSWSASDRYLLSASLDWKCVLWDLKTGTKIRAVRFEAPVFIAQLDPTNHLRFVVAQFEEKPQLVNMKSAADPHKQILPSIPIRNTSGTGADAPDSAAAVKNAKADAKNMTTVTVFSPGGKYILAGTNKGWLNIISSMTGKIVHSHRISSSITIMIRFSPSGRCLLVNSSDRIIRTFSIPFDVDTIPDPTTTENRKADSDNMPDVTNPDYNKHGGTGTNTNSTGSRHIWDSFYLDPEHKFQDLVSRLSWNHVCYNPTGEYILASTWMNHNIYIWERSLGSLVKILEGPKEEFSVVEWHPHRPFIAAVGVDSGNIYFWSVPTPQRWSALAPDFLEVEENIEYVEQEDEFDIRPLEELEKQKLGAEDEELVDVLTLENDEAMNVMSRFISPFILPVTQKRRKTRGQRRRKEEEGGDVGITINESDDDDDLDDYDYGDGDSEGQSDVAAVDGDDDDETSDLEFHMPVWLDVDCADSEDEVVAVGAGQFRRKSPTATTTDQKTTATAINGTNNSTGGRSMSRTPDPGQADESGSGMEMEDQGPAVGGGSGRRRTRK